MKAWIKKWLKAKLGITNLEEELALAKHTTISLKDRIVVAELRAESAVVSIDRTLNQLKEFTKIDADVGIHRRSNNTIILTGTYRNKGYIRFYDMGDGQFKQMAEWIKDMSQHSEVRNIDEPAPFNFKGNFDL